MGSRRLAIIFISFLVAQCALGQMAGFEVQHIANENGLPIGFVRDVIQDRQGFLWISGKDGFYRYDGYEFSAYNKVEKDGRSYNILGDTDLEMDAFGQLWIKDFYNIYQFDTEVLEVQRVLEVHSILQENNAIDINNHDFKIADDGSIWVTSAIMQMDNRTWRANLSHFSSDGQFEFLKTLDFPILVNPSLFLRSDTAWVVGPDLLYRYNAKGKELPTVQIPSEKELVKFFDIFEATDGTIWLKADCREGDPKKVEDGVFFLPANAEKVERLLLPDNLNLEKTNVCIKEENGIWFGGLNHKLIYYDFISKQSYQLDENSGKYADIPFRLSEAQDLIFTEKGVLWYTTSKGLLKIVKESLPVESYLTSVDPNCLYEYCSMRGITEDDKGNIYFAYYSNVNCLNAKSNRLHALLPDGVISPSGVYGLSWLDGFLYLNDLKIDPETGAYYSILEKNGIKKINGHVNNLIDAEGNLLMFSWGPRGLFRYFPQKDSLESIPLSEDYLYHTFEINDLKQGEYTKNIFLASARLGLLVLDENGKKISYHRNSGSDLPLMPSDNIKVVYEDTDSTVWIGHSTGLSLVDFKKKSVQDFPIRNSSSYEVVGILPVDNDKLWISTNLGLFLFDKSNRTYQGFPLHTNLAQLEFNRASFFKSSNNRCYFGTLNGVYSFESDNLLDYLEGREKHKVTLKRLSIYNDKKNEFKITEKRLQTLQNINLTYKDKFFTVGFMLPDYKSPTRIYYTYILDGYETEWAPLTTNPELRYNNLPPGKYTLRIRGGSSERNFPESERSIEVNVEKAWFQTWWFYSLLAIIAFGITQLIFRIRLAQKLRVEKMRTRLSSDLHDDVGSLLSGIAMQSEIMEMSATDGDKQKLQRLTDMSRSAMSRMRDIVWAMDARKDSMENLIDRIREFGMEMLTARDISFAVENKLAPNKKLSPPVRQHLYLICKEAITNVWKHSDGDRMEILFSQKGNGLTLSIHDNGTASAKNFNNSGLGLSNMKMRAEAMGGTISITTDKGVHISIFIPKI